MPNIIDKIISFFKLVGFHLLLTSLISCIPSNPDISIKAQSPLKLSNTEIPHNVSDKIITATPIPGYSILKTNQQGVGYTHQDSDGNRFISGFGVIPDIVPIDIELPGVPAWVVGIPKGDGSVWVVTLDDGQVLGFFVDSHEWEQIDINPSKLSPEQPPNINYQVRTAIFADCSDRKRFSIHSFSSKYMVRLLPVFHQQKWRIDICWINDRKN